MQVTLKDVAEKSGYSVTTVSRALAGYDDVSERTRQHILTVARGLGYQPNLVARQLRSQRTFTIGMIIPSEMSNPEDNFFSILIKGVTHTAARLHYDVLISAQLPNADEMDAYHRIVGGNRVDGMILARTYLNDPRIDYLKTIDHPFVVSGRAAPDQLSDFAFIDVDSQSGIRWMVEHFIAYGHEYIGLILPPEQLAYTAFRFAGYRDGLKAAQIPFRSEYLIHGDLSRDSGYKSTNRLLDRAPQITAIVACNDLMALGAMQAIQNRGLQVGWDIAVGGFDDIPEAAHHTVSLTTIRQPIYEIGTGLTEMLVEQITGKRTSQKGIMLEPELVIRASSGYRRR